MKHPSGKNRVKIQTTIDTHFQIFLRGVLGVLRKSRGSSIFEYKCRTKIKAMVKTNIIDL
jgi:hypothetical protein